MTTSTDTPSVTTESATRSVRFSFTIPAADLVSAVKNVMLFAGTDDTLPSLTGVRFELDESGKLTLAATDRYVLGTQELDVPAIDHASHSGAGAVLLMPDAIKTLAAVKSRGAYELITLTVDESGAVTMALPDTRVISWPSSDDYQYPQWRRFFEMFRPCGTDVQAPIATAYNPAFLAKFAKVRDAGRGRPADTLKLTPGMTTESATTSTITLAECGPVRAVIIQIKLDS